MWKRVRPATGHAILPKQTFFEKKKYPERTLNRFGQIQNEEKSAPGHRLGNIARVNISFDL